MIESFALAVEENNTRLCLELFKKEDTQAKKTKMANCLTKQGFTPMHWAAFNDNLELLKMVYHYGAEPTEATRRNVTAPNGEFIPKGFTPLHACALLNSPECCRQLIKWNIQINAVDARGRTAIYVAAEQGNAETLKSLVNATLNNINHTPDLNISCTAGYDEVGFPGRKGSTALMVAASKSLECVRLLLGHGAQDTATDAYGWTVAHYAAEEAQYDILQYLFEKKINLSVVSTSNTKQIYKNNDTYEFRNPTQAQFTPLHVAIRMIDEPIQAYLQCIRFLAEHIDVNRVDQRGWSHLHWACYKNDIEIVKLLFEGATASGQHLDFTLRTSAIVRAKIPVKETTASAVTVMDQRGSNMSDIYSKDIKTSSSSSNNGKVVEFPLNCIPSQLAFIREAYPIVELLVKWQREAQIEASILVSDPIFAKEPHIIRAINFVPSPFEEYVSQKLVADDEVERAMAKLIAHPTTEASGLQVRIAELEKNVNELNIAIDDMNRELSDSKAGSTLLKQQLKDSQRREVELKNQMIQAQVQLREAEHDRRTKVLAAEIETAKLREELDRIEKERIIKQEEAANHLAITQTQKIEQKQNNENNNQNNVNNNDNTEIFSPHIKKRDRNDSFDRMVEYDERESSRTSAYREYSVDVTFTKNIFPQKNDGNNYSESLLSNQQQQQHKEQKKEEEEEGGCCCTIQ